MARKQNARRAEDHDTGGVLVVETIHGKFTRHPLLEAVLAADVLPWKKELPDDVSLAKERQWIVQALGEWLYEVSSKGPDAARADLETFLKLLEHVDRKQSVETIRHRALTAHTKISAETGILPSAKQLKGVISGLDRCDDHRTLRRELKKLGLPFYNHKSISRIRNIAEALSDRGRRAINVSELRRRLTERAGKTSPQLPNTRCELVALCASCGARLEKRQLLAAFHDLLKARHGVVTDWDLAVALPSWVRDYYGLADRKSLRAYAKTIHLSLPRAKAWNREDVSGKAPKVDNS